MARAFAITAANTTIQLDSKGIGDVSFTVTNTSTRRLRGRAKVVAKDSTNRSWLSIAGEAERDFPPDATQQITIRVEAPQGSPAGSYQCTLSVASVDNPDEDYAEGPVVSFEVTPSEKPAAKFPWWILVVAAAVLVVGALSVYLLTRKSDAKQAIRKVAIPRVADLSEARAKQQLEQLCEPQPCLTVKIVRKADERVDEGKAIGTDPEEGAAATSGSEITLFVSSGPKSKTLSSVAGMKEAPAKQFLESLCDKPLPPLHVQVLYEQTDEFDNGVAIRTEPPANSPVKCGDVVKLFVSDMVASGTVDVTNKGVDLDTGAATTVVLGITPPQTDVVFSGQYFNPGSTAKIVSVGDSPLHPKGCLEASTSVGYSIVTPNKYVCVHTNEGRISEFKVLTVNPTRIQFKTWNDPSKFRTAGSN